jgi:hypothetical protein
MINMEDDKFGGSRTAESHIDRNETSFERSLRVNSRAQLSKQNITLAFFYCNINTR